MRDTLRSLRAFAQPILDERHIYAQFFFLSGGYGIKKTEPLQVSTVATVAPIGGYDVIKRPLFSAATGQSNGDHFCVRYLNKTDRRAALPSRPAE